MIRVFENFEGLRQGWEELVEKAAFSTVFQTYEWNSTWWEHLGGSERPCLVACYDGDRLIGIAPLMELRVKVKGIPAYSVLTFVGHPDSDYLDFVLDPRQCEPALQEIVGWCFQKSTGWRILELPEIHENSPTKALLGKVLGAMGVPYYVARDSPCPGLDISGKRFGEYMESLSYETRKKTRKNTRRLERDHKIEYVEGGPDSIATFFSLNKGRWATKNMPGSIKTEAVKSFHVDVSRKLAEYLNMGLLLAEGKPIAVQYSYDFRGNRCVYLQGMETEFEYYSPGIVLMINRIEDAISKGFQYYDLMRGDEKYKYQYMKTLRHNSRFYIAGDRIKLEAFRLIEGLSTRLMGRPLR